MPINLPLIHLLSGYDLATCGASDSLLRRKQYSKDLLMEYVSGREELTPDRPSAAQGASQSSPSPRLVLDLGARQPSGAEWVKC